MAKKFIRRTWNRYSKLGKRRKKKQSWRRPKGRDNKMREKKRGYASVVSMGYKKNKKIKGKIKGKVPVLINNINDLEKIQKNQIIVLGKVGKKKKIDIVKKSKELKLGIANLNINKFLKELEKKAKDKKPEEKKEKEAEKQVEKKEIEKKDKEAKREIEIKKIKTTETEKTKETEK